MPGNKELKEALVGVNELALLLVEHLKDGVDLSDAVAIWGKLQGDPQLLTSLKAAVEGLQHVSAEASDLDALEVVDLVQVQCSYVPRLLAALKKVEPPKEQAATSA